MGYKHVVKRLNTRLSLVCGVDGSGVNVSEAEVISQCIRQSETGLAGALSGGGSVSICHHVEEKPVNEV